MPGRWCWSSPRSRAGRQAAFAVFSPVLCTFVSATAAVLALYPLSRWRRFAEPADALLGATTVGDPSLVGGILRRAIPWAIAAGLLISLATLGFAALPGGG